MERKTYTVYDNYDVYSDQNMAEAKACLIEDGMAEADITEDLLTQHCYDDNEVFFEDEKWELEHVSEGPVIAIADIGRWNGRFSGYKTLDSLEKVMYSSCDYERVYVDSNGDLRKEESHHDGSNSILYRYWKDGLTEEQKENFLDKIYNGKCTQKDITRYTRKAGLGIANAYGWTVRGGENKYKKVA